MRKIFVSLVLVYFISNFAYAADSIHIDEVKLDTTNSKLPMLIKTQEQKKDEYDEIERYQQEEQRQMDLYNQGQDYMFRMQQQMMRPVRMNQFGGYSY